MRRLRYAMGIGFVLCALVVVLGWIIVLRLKGSATPQSPVCALRYPPKLDLGTGFVADKLDGTFVLTNTSDHDIKFGPVQTSCGCTASMTKLDVVPARSETRVQVVMSIKKEGLNEESLRFPVASPAQEPSPVVHVLATGVTPVTIEPRLVDFGMLAQEELPCTKVLRVQTHPEWGKPTVSVEGEGVSLRQVGSTEYQITATSSLPTGLSVRQVVIQSATHPTSRLTVPVHIRVNGELELTPRFVTIGPLQVGAVFERHLQLRIKERGALQARWKGDDCSAEILIGGMIGERIMDVILRGRCNRAGLTRGYAEVETPGTRGRDTVPVMVIGKPADAGGPTTAIALDK